MEEGGLRENITELLKQRPLKEEGVRMGKRENIRVRPVQISSFWRIVHSKSKEPK